GLLPEDPGSPEAKPARDEEHDGIGPFPESIGRERSERKGEKGDAESGRQDCQKNAPEKTLSAGPENEPWLSERGRLIRLVFRRLMAHPHYLPRGTEASPTSGRTGDSS